MPGTFHEMIREMHCSYWMRAKLRGHVDVAWAARETGVQTSKAIVTLDQSLEDHRKYPRKTPNAHWPLAKKNARNSCRSRSTGVPTSKAHFIFLGSPGLLASLPWVHIKPSNHLPCATFDF